MLQIFVTYGERLSNVQLLLNFGFLLPDNFTVLPLARLPSLLSASQASTSASASTKTDHLGDPALGLPSLCELAADRYNPARTARTAHAVHGLTGHRRPGPTSSWSSMSVVSPRPARACILSTYAWWPPPRHLITRRGPSRYLTHYSLPASRLSPSCPSGLQLPIASEAHFIAGLVRQLLAARQGDERQRALSSSVVPTRSPPSSSPRRHPADRIHPQP